ncbi:hypothetical protein D0Y65_011760 [Glycine soja]|uniref:Uncharacterized protein n=1 Tax=Glycine soja TaxID=3848 RepID=A0A445KLC8_GLYSO|nr:hypothetical protein D0Y65_011760 [Glycine soja]
MKGAQAYDAMMQRILFEPCGRRVRWRARDRVHPHMSLYGLCDPSASPSHKKSLAGKQQQSWFVGFTFGLRMYGFGSKKTLIEDFACEDVESFLRVFANLQRFL